MGRPPKATCQASKHSHHGEDPFLLKTSMCQMSGTSPPCPSPPKHDVKLKNRTFYPSWANRLESEGWAMLSKSSSRPSKSDLSHPACGPLTSNLWACSPMEALLMFMPLL
jgi:hypothetical protein